MEAMNRKRNNIAENDHGPLTAEPHLDQLATPSDSESDLSSAPSNPIDPDAPTIKPRKRTQTRPQARHVEEELHLTSKQGKRLRDLIQSELKKAGVLGELNFTSKMTEDTQKLLQQIYATAKQELDFLEAADVSEARLDELLYQRTLIINSNERHNRYMVKAGRVRQRLGEAAAEEQRQSPQTQDEGTSSPPTSTSVEDTEPPAVASFLLRSLDLCNGVVSAYAPEQSPGSPMQIDYESEFQEPGTERDELHPIAFIVRVINSTAGAAIHISQLVPSSPQDKPVTVKELNFETFLDLASGQVHFNVRGCISAVVPSTCIAIASNDIKIALVSEDIWKAVLQAWQSAGCKTCEFVVERAEVDGPDGRDGAWDLV